MIDNKPQWSDWYWGDTGIFRHRYSDWRIEAVHFPAVERRETAREEREEQTRTSSGLSRSEQTGTSSGLSRSATAEECSDCAYLEKHLEQLHRLKQELIDRAAQAKGSRKREFEQGIKSKEGQIEYVSKRLATLEPPKLGANNQLEESAMPESVAVAIEVVEELTEDEQRDRLRLERRVERSLAQAEKHLFDAARDLKEIRDRKLFRSTHDTFGEYIQDRFSLAKSSAYYQIKAVEVIDNFKFPPMVEILPTSERQIRPLTKLEPEQQRQAWLQAVELAGNKVPSGRIVKDVVTQMKEAVRRRANVPLPFQVGEVCQLVVKGNPNLRGKGGCWCIVVEVCEFSLMVSVQGEKYQVKPENLKPVALSGQQQEEYKENYEYIDELYLKYADQPLIIAMLDQWFYEKRYWFNPVEREFLDFLRKQK